MGTPITKKSATSLVAAPSGNMHPDGMGFDITSTIGSVRFGTNGVDATGEAMRIIGEFRKPGVYRFPHEDGGDWVVELSHSGGPQQEAEGDSWRDE